MSNLWRATSIRSDANKGAKAKKAAAAVSRTGQVSRSSVSVRDDEVMLDELMAGAVDTAEVTVEHSGDLGLLDDAAVTDFDAILDAGGAADVDDMIDAADAIPDLGEEFEAEAELAEQNHVAHMLAIEVAQGIDTAIAEAEAAANDAANALTSANGKNARRRGVTEPDPPEGGWAQGDQWIRDAEQPDGSFTPVEALVWNGTEFVQEQIMMNELFVLGENGVVRIADGKITAQAIAADALNFKTAQGMELYGSKIVGGEITLADATPETTVWSTDCETTDGWGGTEVASSILFVSGSRSVRGKVGPGLGAGLYYSPASAVLGEGNLLTAWVRSSVRQELTLAGFPHPSTQSVGVIEANTWTRIRVEFDTYTPHSLGFEGAIQGSTLWVDDFVFSGAESSPNSGISLYRDAQAVATLESRAGLTRSRLRGGILESLTTASSASSAKLEPAHLTLGIGSLGYEAQLDYSSLAFKSTNVGTGGGARMYLYANEGQKDTLGLSADTIGLYGKTTQPGNVFALKSQLNAWAAIDGTHAWVTSEGREYVRTGGRWRCPEPLTGQVTLAAPAGGGNARETVPFEPGYFTSPPRVFVSAADGAGSTVTVNISAVTVTKDSADINLNRSNQTNTRINWIAYHAD